MSGFLRRLTDRSAATADEAPAVPEDSGSSAAPADTPAEAGGNAPVSSADEAAASPADEQPTEALPPTGEVQAAASGEAAAPADRSATSEQAGSGEQPAPAAIVPAAQPVAARDLPAGVDPEALNAGPEPSSHRGKARRRLRYLRQARELLLRDLGGFTYEVHRTGGGVLRESHRRLLETKTGRLAALDAEARELESRLSEPRAATVLRQPGVGGTCPACGELHGSDAHYCSRCGEPLDDKARAQREAAIREAMRPAPPPHPTPEPKPASVLWAAGPRPAAAASAAAEERSDTSPATSEWVTGGTPPESTAGRTPPESAAGRTPPESAAGRTPADKDAGHTPSEQDAGNAAGQKPARQEAGATRPEDQAAGAPTEKDGDGRDGNPSGAALESSRERP
jgi:hypothetical protein